MHNIMQSYIVRMIATKFLPLKLSFVHVLGLNCFNKFCFQKKNSFIHILPQCIRCLFLQPLLMLFINLKPMLTPFDGKLRKKFPYHNNLVADKDVI